MIRETLVLMSIFMLFPPNDAIKCYECNSLITPSCADDFKNFSTRIVDCAQQQLYDLTPIDYCRKIKYKENGNWIYLRGCNMKDHLQMKTAEYHWCNTNLCNVADNHRPTILLFALLFTSFLFIKLLRF